MRNSLQNLITSKQITPKNPSGVQEDPPDRNGTFQSIKRFLSRSNQVANHSTIPQGTPRIPNTNAHKSNPSQVKMKVKPAKIASKCPRQPPITRFCNYPPIKSLADDPKGPPPELVPPLDPGEKSL